MVENKDAARPSSDCIHSIQDYFPALASKGAATV